jgi:hypothetical protein
MAACKILACKGGPKNKDTKHQEHPNCNQNRDKKIGFAAAGNPTPVLLRGYGLSPVIPALAAKVLIGARPKT